MRRTILLLSFVGAMFLAFSGVVLAQTNTPRDSANENANERSADKAPLQKPERGSIPGRYIVVLNDDAKSPEEVAASEEEAASNAKEENDAREVANQHAADEAFTPDFVYNRALRGYAARLSDAQLERVRSKPEVKFVSLDHEVQAHQKTDPSSKSSKAQDSSSTQDSSKPSSPKEEEATAQGTQPLTSGDKMVTGVQRIGAGSATTAYQTANPSVAVIDTGIDLSHPDLNAYTGKNCVNPGTNPTARDDNGHGTHVAGTIGAKNNGSGVVGVAPGTKQFSVKVLNSNGSGSWSQVICGIDWVSNNAAVNGNNIQIVNMSLGGSGSNDNNCGNTNSDALHQAICRSTNNHWMTYSVSAGNSGTGFWTKAPASYPEVLTVTAISDSDGKTGGTGGAPTCRSGERDDYYATFSNYARDTSTTDQNHTIGAPGVCILSSAMGGGTKTMSGTSMASPHVAGTIAVCVGTNGGFGPCARRPPREKIQQIRSDTQAYATNTNGFSGDPFRPVSGEYYGYLTWAGGY